MEKSKAEKSGIRPGIVVVVVLVVGTLIAGRMLGWFGSRKNPNESGDGPAAAGTSPGTPATPVASTQPAPTGPRVTGTPGLTSGSNPRNTSTPGPRRASVPGAASTPEPVPGSTEPGADWSAKLDDILGSKDDEGKKAEQLLSIWKNAPEDGQVELMQHISNLLPDEKFSALAQAFTNATTPEAVLDVLMTDTLNRPNGLKLPVLLDVARTPGHPKAEEARDILEVFVDANHGTDWSKWEKAVKDWLKENPDEPEPTN